MSSWLVIMSPWASMSIIFIFLLVTSIGPILIVRRFVDHSLLKPHNDIAGFVYATVGVIYGVVFGLCGSGGLGRVRRNFPFTGSIGIPPEGYEYLIVEAGWDK